MLDSSSIKARFAMSVASNATRAGLSFLSGLLVARALDPSGYGDLTFLLVSFSAIRTLLDMGSSNAFYTFISRERMGRGFFLFYGAWLCIQFMVVAGLVALIMPDELVTRIWLDHSRQTILLAFGAAFLQQQVWQTITQIGESARKTVRVQTMNMAVAGIHFMVIALFFMLSRLTVELIFTIIMVEYALAGVIASRFLKTEGPGTAGEPVRRGASEMLREYGRYCRPLILLSWIGFAYSFADGWLLQRFGGPGEQGFYQIASQFANISLIATTSILNILWKEIAEADERGDSARVAMLYTRVNRGLLMLGAVMSGLLIPWATEITTVTLGSAYAMAAPVMMLMFLYPIHQSMGQVGGTMLLASKKTSSYMLISGCFMLISLPIAYLVQAPPSASPVPGLGLGAQGMALKTVILNIISVNVQAWVVARYCRIPFDWAYQAVIIGAVVVIGYASRHLSGLFWELSSINDALGLIPPFSLSLVAYLTGVSLLIWSMPHLAGITRPEIRSALRRLRPSRS